MLSPGPEGTWYACGRAEVADVREFLTRLGAVAARHDVTCQAVRADAVAGKAHLDYCVARALRAHRQGENLAQQVGLELLLYLRGRRQISKALELGVCRGENRLVMVFIGEDARRAAEDAQAMLEPADVIAYTPAKRDFMLKLHGITPEEIAAAGEDALPLLCRERAVLLELEK